MYFQKKTNTFYSIFININSALRYFLVFLFIFLLLIFWFFTLHVKFEDKETQLKSEIRSLHQKENLFLKISKEIEEYSFDIKKINDQINKILETYPKDDQEIGIDLLMKIAKSMGLLIIKCNSEDQISKKLYDKNIIAFSFIGSFYQIVNFFKELSLSKQWIKCTKMNISLLQDDQIQIDCIYKFYIPKKDAKWLKEEVFIPF